MDFAGISVKLYRIRAQLTMRLHQVCTAQQGKGLYVDLDILRLGVHNILDAYFIMSLFPTYMDLSEN